jgi:hypothetical protein
MDERGAQARSKKAAARPDRGEGVVQEFLDRLAHALTRGDGRTVASMWAVPALVIGDDEIKAVSSLQEVELFFSGAKEHYNTRGITDTHADIQRLEWATDRIALVDVRWPYLDSRGNEMGEEASTYILKRDDAGDLKLHVALMRGASTPD